MTSRTGVLLGLLGFGLLGCALTWWGWSDLSALLRDARACVDPVKADSSSVWLLGMVSLLALPGLLLVPERRHGTLFAVMLVVFLGAPALGYVTVRDSVADQGYGMESFPPLFSLRAFELTAPDDCARG